MMNIKEYIKKKLPILHQAHIKYIQRKVYKRHIIYNNIYKKSIDKLVDEKTIADKIERIKSKVENNGDYTVYIIAFKHPGVGIWGYITNILPHLAYAISNEFVPVIDMKNYPSIYQSENENAWEKFFEQPFGIGLDDLKDKRKKYCPTDFWYTEGPKTFPMITESEIKLWYTVFINTIKYNDLTVEYIKDEEQRILKDSQRTIGVLYRGTDYTLGHAHGHPVQPSREMVVAEIQKWIEKYNYKYIYVASEEKAIIDYLENSFPGKILINKRMFYDVASSYDKTTRVDFSNYNNDHIGLSGVKFDRNNNEYLIGIEYISSINLLSKCDCFIGGACGGTTASLIINGLKYSHTQVFQLGRYGIDDIKETLHT